MERQLLERQIKAATGGSHIWAIGNTICSHQSSWKDSSWKDSSWKDSPQLARQLNMEALAENMIWRFGYFCNWMMLYSYWRLCRNHVWCMTKMQNIMSCFTRWFDYFGWTNCSYYSNYAAWWLYYHNANRAFPRFSIATARLNRLEQIRDWRYWSRLRRRRNRNP